MSTETDPDPLGTLLFEMTFADGDSSSPLQMISAELLAYYRRRDAELTALLAVMQQSDAVSPSQEP